MIRADGTKHTWWTKSAGTINALRDQLRSVTFERDRLQVALDRDRARHAALMEPALTPKEREAAWEAWNAFAWVNSVPGSNRKAANSVEAAIGAVLDLRLKEGR